LLPHLAKQTSLPFVVAVCRVVPDDEYQLVMLDDGLLLSAFQTV
jgi:hypothetical protein